MLKPIEEAVVATHGDAAARKQLEEQLNAVLGQSASRDAKDYVCRKLKVVGTAHSVPALAALLPDEELSHMARYALESMPNPQAGAALREALPRLSGMPLAGVIGSLGVRQDEQSVEAIADHMESDDPAVSLAATQALGAIGTAAAAQLLAAKQPASPAAQQAVADASLACAERLLAAGRKSDAQQIYTRLAKQSQPKHVRLAATRGMLASRS